MEKCPKCSNQIIVSNTNVAVNVEQPWKKVQAKICLDCNFMELFRN